MKKRHYLPDFIRSKYSNPFTTKSELFKEYREENYKTFVYFISDGEYVKIGYATDVNKRLVGLQTGNPKKLSILFVINADRAVEKYLHSCYKQHKSINEWFKIQPTKEEVLNLLVNNIIPIKKEPFVIVYTSVANKLLIGQLPNRAKGVLMWIYYEIEIGKDYVYVNREKLMEEMKISKNTLTEAINDLVRVSILCATAVNSVYWVNPILFFSNNDKTDNDFENQIIKEE